MTDSITHKNYARLLLYLTNYVCEKIIYLTETKDIRGD